MPVKEGSVLEAVQHSIRNTQIETYLTKKAKDKPADGARGTSANIPLMLLAAALLLWGNTKKWIVEWWHDEIARRLWKRLMANETGTGQYTGFVLAACAAAWAHLPAPVAELVLRYMSKVLALCALFAVPWEVKRLQRLSPALTVLGTGERVEEHHFGAPTLILAHVLGLPVNKKWKAVSPNVIATLPKDLGGSGKNFQGIAWAYRVFVASGVAGELKKRFGEGLIDLLHGRDTPKAAELLHGIDIPMKIRVLKSSDALAGVYSELSNTNSTGGYGVLIRRGQEPLFLVPDKPGPGQRRLRSHKQIGPGNATMHENGSTITLKAVTRETEWVPVRTAEVTMDFSGINWSLRVEV